MSGGGNFTDHHLPIRSNPSASEEPELESHGSKKKGIKVLLKQLDGRTSGRRLNRLNLDREVDSPFHQMSPSHNALGNGAPPEWALLLIGCFLGLATGLCVAAFNRGGAVGLAIWVPSVANQAKENEASDSRTLRQGYSSLSPVEDKGQAIWRQVDGGNVVELSDLENAVDHEIDNEDTILDELKVSHAMSKYYVKLSPQVTVKAAVKFMHDKQQNCVIVVDAEDLVVGILTLGDVRRGLSKASVNSPKNDFVSFRCECMSCFVSLHPRNTLSRKRMWAFNLLSRHRFDNCKGTYGGQRNQTTASG